MTSSTTIDEASAKKISHKNVAIVWGVALVIVLLSLVAHLTSNSTMHLSEEMWQRKITAHRNAFAFKVRPLTTTIVVTLHDHAGIPYRTGFMALQFTLYLLSGLAFWLFLRTLGFRMAYALAGMIVFLLTMPLFMAHFEPVHTWSDFWVYLLVPLSFTMALKRHYVMAVVAITMALMARETTLLFLPIWFLFVYVDRNRRFPLATALTLLSVALFVGIRLWLFGFITVPPENGPGYNFENYLRGSDTIFSLLVSLGFVWVVGLWQALRSSHRIPHFYNVVRFGAVFTAAGFVSSTLLMARARETRLFAPPVILLVPLVLVYVQERADRFKSLLRRLPSWSTVLAGAILLLLSIWVTKLAFPKFEYRLWRDGNWAFLALHIALVVVFLLVELGGGKRVSLTQQGKN